MVGLSSPRFGGPAGSNVPGGADTIKVRAGHLEGKFLCPTVFLSQVV